MIEYKRGRKVQTACADQRQFDSRCESYRLVESKIRFGNSNGNGYPPRWYAMKLCGRRSIIISTHRKRSAAERAIEKYDRSRVRTRELATA